MSAYRSRKIEELPARLRDLIYAAEFRTDGWGGGDVHSVAKALREFGVLARWGLLVHGVFVPNNDDVSVIVRQIADDHLGLKDARCTFREALEAVETFEQRDRIESAHGQVQSASDETHFYAGLAFGLALADDC
jgi:hypothetical protein